MKGTRDGRLVDRKGLILWPAVITLAVTLLRLAGELLGGSDSLFNRAPGGPGAIVGIVWLVPVFGYYFGHRLARMGFRPGSVGRLFGFALLAIAVFAGLIAIMITLLASPLAQLAVSAVASWIAIVIARRAWPELWSVLLAYGLAARIPVAVVMLLAMLGSWGTHYDAMPPDFPAMGVLRRWVSIGLVPQLTGWMAVTVLVGMLVGGVAAVIASRTPAASPAAA
jgi:hypothetical protein